ncbi:MAG: phage major capsid protein [Aphanocapsa sp. GSE-SYN-MK-11-07L]|jgi:HK97 family phage major capsid protein|nr:phage major capsid protein [Aphanocapsa sp. GSE-SYN-MK-11-07L]
MALPFNVRSLLNRKLEAVLPLSVEKQSADTIEFAFSSEYPYKRPWGLEILSHEPEAVDLSYLRSGVANWLWNHDSDNIIGSIIDARIENRRGRCIAKWSALGDAPLRRAQVQEGTLRGISCRYEIMAAVQNGEEVLITRWRPVEISLTAVPVDPTVGLGRQRFTNKGGNGMNTYEIREIEEKERDRISSIRGYGQRHGREELAERLISQGTDLETARGLLLDSIMSNTQSPVAAIPNESVLGLSRSDQKKYSLARAILAWAEKDWSGAGFERECHEALAQRSSKPPQGLLIPVHDLMFTSQKRATYMVGTPSTGGNLVATDLLSESFVDALRNRCLTLQLGASLLSGLVGNTDVPRRTASANTFWVAEDAPITQSEGLFDVVSLRPRTVGALSRFSRLTLLQATPAIEDLIRSDFAAILATEIDRVSIAGSGTGGVPRGILNTPGIGSVALGANGAAPSWANVVALETLLSNANADVGSLGYLTNSKVRGVLKNTLKPSPSSEFIIGDSGQSTPGFERLNGYRCGISNNIPSNLAKGSGTNLSAILFANWADLLIGQWGAMEILSNPYGENDFSAGRIAVRAMMTLDIGIRRPASFAAITDCITT